jgi:hypothetical protein
MMARKAFTEHPQFMTASRIANDAVIAAAESFGALAELGSLELEARTNRIVDDLTRLLLASLDKSLAKAA